MPRVILYILLLVVMLSLIPVGMVYKSMHSAKSQTRIQVVWDMDDQVYHKAQSANPFFADGRSARLHPEGTVARGLLREDDAYHLGSATADTVYVDEFPVAVTDGMMVRGRERFAIYCAPCHGLSGNGMGPVHAKATALAEGTWTPPTDLASETVVDRPVGHIYNTIRNGIRNMPAYGSQIDTADRWAIVAYVRALQLSRNATLDDMSPAEREALETERQQTRAAAAEAEVAAAEAAEAAAAAQAAAATTDTTTAAQDAPAEQD